MALEVIILAAGKGTRMRSNIPKVLHQVGGKSMLQRVVETAFSLQPNAIHIVTGHASALVTETLLKALATSNVDHDQLAKLHWRLQSQQQGSGHAVSMAMPMVADDATCLLLYGDVPLVAAATLATLCASRAALSVLTAKPDNPDGFGRIVRDDSGQVIAVVEQQEATPAQLEIDEINTGVMACQAIYLGKWLGKLDNNNQSGEFYLTDIVALSVAENLPVVALVAEPATLYLGVNSKSELARAERTLQTVLADTLMHAGVTIIDPARLTIRGDVTCGSDCVIDVNVVLQGNVVIGDNVMIAPNCVIANASIGNNSHIAANSMIEDAVIGDGCNIGPFARLRPATKLANGVRIGNFVEVKNSQLGVDSKANHLAYLGDSIVGSNVNIGAGVITCNYDGVNKHQTIIGNNVFVGSDSQLVAPVNIGAGATIGAGTTITKNVEAEALAIARAPQQSIRSWQRPTKPSK